MMHDNEMVFTRTFVNNYKTTDEFFTNSLSKFNFADASILRPDWDTYFM